MDARRARERLEDRRRQVVADLAELEDQVAGGEIEPPTAQRLREVYATELAEIEAALAETGDAPVPEEDEPEEPRPPRGFSPAVAVGAAALLGILTGLIIWAGTGSGPGSSASPDSSSTATVAAGAIDIAALSTEELESALASFPDSADVRLALADRYLSQGDRKAALEHYLVVAAGDASPQQKSRALARVGYLSYATGQYEAARDTLLESLSLNEDNTEAMLYLGYVLLNGLGDEAGAITYFERVVADPAMPPEVVEAVSGIIADARRGER